MGVLLKMVASYISLGTISPAMVSSNALNKYPRELIKFCLTDKLIWSFAANIFGKPKSNTDFLPYNGDGFKLSIPAKWNPSKEREFPGQVLRYEDNFDATSNLSVMVTPTDTKSIADYGSPEEFLSKVMHNPLS